MNAPYSPEIKINRNKVNSAIESKLNETDWKVLDILYQNPIATNKQIAGKIYLSVEGVRSSLKKMYRLYNIQQSAENQKIALTIAVMKISGELR